MVLPTEGPPSAPHRTIAIPAPTKAHFEEGENLKVFKIDKITIFSKSKVEIKDQYIAINTNNSFNNTNYQALLSPLML